MPKYPTPTAKIITKQAQLDNLRKEDVLNLGLSPLDQQIAEQEVKDCNQYLQTSSGSKLKFLINKIPIRNFDTLFDEATAIEPGITEGYITAIKISLGFADRNTNTITPIFTHLKLKKSTDGATGTRNYETILPVSGEKNYIFDNNNFQLCVNDEKLEYTSIYKDRIRILHVGDATHSPFRQGDTEDVIFPFQTLYTLELENDNPQIKEVFLFNSIRKNISGEQIVEIKHCILLSPEIPVGIIFNGKFANRSHLCPPDCKKLLYDVI